MRKLKPAALCDISQEYVGFFCLGLITEAEFMEKLSAFLATPFRSLRRLPLLAALLVMPLWGCGAIKAYEGPELTKSEISVINRRHSHGGSLMFLLVLPIPSETRHRTWVEYVDGNRGARNVFPRSQFHVRPGQHTATVVYRDIPVALCGPLGCGHPDEVGLTITFTTEAGHEYRIPAERRNGRDWIWVEDITIGKVVAGEKPP